MLTSIYLENFKKHKKLRVEFTPGVNVILGQNYAGKTTILEAIAYAFRGPLAVEGGNSVIQHDDGGKVKVVLNFEADGCDWILVRKQDTASLESNDGRMANGTTPVNGLLRDLMGFDAKLFNVLKYSEQGDTQLLLKEGETKVNQMLERLSGIDLVDVILNNLKTYKTVASGIMDGLETVTGEQIGNQEIRTNNVEIKAAQLLKATGTASLGYDSALKSRDRTKETLSTLREARNDQIKIMQDQARIQSSIDDKTAQLAEYETEQEEFEDLTDETVESKEVEVTQAETRFGEYSSLSHDWNAKSRAVNTCQTAITKAEEEIEELQSRKEAAEQSLKSAMTIAELSKREDTYRTLARREDKLIDAMENGVCETCHRPFEGAEDAEVLQTELDQVRESLDPANAAYREGQKDMERTSDLNSEVTRIEAYIDSHTTALNESHNQKYEAERAVADVNQKLKDLKKGPSILPEGEIENLQNELTDMLKRNVKRLHLIEMVAKTSNSLGMKQQSFADLPVFEPIDDEDYEHAQAHLDEAESNFRIASNDYATLQGDLKLAESTAAHELARLKDMKRVIEDSSKYTAQIDKADRLSKFLRKNRTTLLSNIWATVLAQASYVIGMITGGAVDSVLRIEGIGLAYREGGRDKPIAAASGCQKTVIGVAIRSAIAKLFEGHLKFMLLDEISSDMDSEHVSATMAILEQLNDQIILITHSDAELRDSHNIIEL